MLNEKLFARISPLFDVGALGNAKVLIAGCGSGGGQVALQLVMAGVQNFTLFDKDVLQEENVIRHICGLRYVGQRKVDAVADVLRDRNPEVNVSIHDIDLMRAKDLDEHIQNSTIVVIATDNEPTRYRLNQLCVDNEIPFAVGKVFTRGIGGEVFSFRPGESGCLACLESVLQRTQYRDGVREIDLVSDEERNKLYGMEITEIKDSPGLNVDISFITSFHTRFTLDGIARRLPEPPQHFLPIGANYVVWGNRPVHPFERHFQIQSITLHPQEGCLICSGNQH